MTITAALTEHRRGLSVVVGAGVVVAVVVRLGTGSVLDGLRAVSPGALGAALALGLLSTAASATRWCVVARGLDLTIPFPTALGDCYRAQFLNCVLPAGVLGDVHRAVDHGRRNGDVGRGVRAVVLERGAGQVVTVGVGMGVLLAVPGPVRDVVGHPAPVLVEAAAVALVLLLAVAGLRRARRALARLVGGRDGSLTARTVPAVLGLSLVAMAGHLALLEVAARAAGVTAGAGQVAPPLVLSLLSAGLPLSVGGWGPREATTATAFGLAGLGAGTGLATAVAFGVLTLVSTLPGLGVLVLRSSRARRRVVGGLVPGAQRLDRGPWGEHRDDRRELRPSPALAVPAMAPAVHGPAADEPEPVVVGDHHPVREETQVVLVGAVALGAQSVGV